jgi:hypothetical protein
MRFIRRKVTFANVIAAMALFIALGGLAVAAGLPKNSVGSKQLKKNAVTAVKVKKHTLTGKQINLAKLGTVPAATQAIHAASADALPPAEAIHLIGSAGNPPFENGAKAAPSESGISIQPPAYYRDQIGIVHLEGVVDLSEVTTPILFRMPAGLRPAAGQLAFFPSAPEGGTVIIGGSGVASGGIDLGGSVLASPGSGNKFVTLSGVNYRPAS